MDGVRSRAADRGSRTATDHDTHVQWLVAERARMIMSGFVGMENVEVLAMWSGSVFEAFAERNKTRRPVMDACFRPLGVSLPTVVVMSGWSHTGKDMFRDMRDYMECGNGTTKMVLILKWEMDKPTAAVSCELKVYEYVRNRPDGVMFIMKQREEIIPGTPNSQDVKIKLGDMCAFKLPEGADAEKEYSMSVPLLRNTALRFIREDKFRPEGCEVLDEDSDEVGSGDDDVGLLDSNNREVFGEPGPTMVGPTVVGATVTNGSSNQSHISGHHSGNNQSNNENSFNEEYKARNLSVIKLILPEDYLTHSLQVSKKKDLGVFFNGSQRWLKRLSRRLSETGQQVCDNMQVSYDHLSDLNKVALYDTVILCDDSGSMKLDGRYEMMRKAILTISDVCTAFRDEGISVKFLNFKGDKDYNEIHDKKKLDEIIMGINPKGGTRLGTVLRNKIVEPLIIQKAREKKLVRPVLITIITDGQPAGEDRGELKRTILNCKNELKRLPGPGNEEFYGDSSVAFQISLVGNSDQAKSYIKELEEDPEVGDLVYCTRERLDIVKSQMKETQYTGWLIQLLAAGIDH
ncbi:hypothetical protein L873DRAFT_1805781 [Choiromyces venosus 120613-1]|uniref:VWFA domain-containing protein n=1 Tax=Choiromyces venosus 120613-1 TaxID=1336337 RepID=A0A3N4JP40_9PEZI|nr:hypothetical protein L873DRAFT_1805781 [Choiromyces venosus 120613-1]